MTYDAFDVVVVPFPFTDRGASRRRPALVLSSRSGFNALIGHSIMAMITTAARSSWPLDIAITDLAAAGLPAASIVRMKLFSLDDRLVLRRAGSLAASDRKSVGAALNRVCADSL